MAAREDDNHQNVKKKLALSEGARLFGKSIKFETVSGKSRHERGGPQMLRKRNTFSGDKSAGFHVGGVGGESIKKGGTPSQTITI